MSGTPTDPIVPPRRQAPAVGGVPAKDEGIRPQQGLPCPPGRAPTGGLPGVGLRVFCGAIAAFAAMMFAALVVLGLKEADRAIRRVDLPQTAPSAARGEKTPSSP